MEREPDQRDRRYSDVVQLLRARQAEDREAREKRQRWYRQSLETNSTTDDGAVSEAILPPTRLYKFGTKVPCRMTAEATALLEQLRKRFSGCAVSLQQVTGGRQALVLTGGTGTDRKQIGWVEHCVETDPQLCNVRNHGLSVETDGESLVLRFRYPQTGVRMTSGCRSDPETRLQPQDDGLELVRYAADGARSVNFVEIRPALDQRLTEKGSSPRLVWLTRPELDFMNCLDSRDYESFYVRFKLELQAGIWSSLSGLLANGPSSQWYRGSCYTVVTEPDASLRKIVQRTIDDGGRPVDIGADRTYDAAPATDILLLYLEGDILADIADIYFTLRSIESSDSYSLKEEFFAVIRRFWAHSQSLASRYGSDVAAVMRMSQRAIPMPAQSPLLKQDWTNLRQSLADRYGEGGRNAADLRGSDILRPAVGPLAWPFSAFPPGEINVGLRLVYRQEWRHVGFQRGDVIQSCHSERSEESAPNPISASFRTARRGAEKRRTVETTIEQGTGSTSLSELVDKVVSKTLATMKWPRDFDGGIHTGVRGLAVTTDMDLESESRENSREVTNRLSDISLRLATEIRAELPVRQVAEPEKSLDSPPAIGSGAPTYVHSKLQNCYEVLTRAAEIQNVVLVAEQLPSPTEIDLSWIRRHDWILGKVLLDESFRDALNTIGEDDRARADVSSNQQRFIEHLRANILHYQRAIWRQEDPQQRSMRYRKSGKKVPLDWRFELESAGTLTIDELGDRLSSTNVDGQFAAYSGGREADLDQVIDPSGPIGYYGNYAVYQMRAEFGSADLFSMLHFFKSPYLRPNPETGTPEVEDPSIGVDVLRHEQTRRIAFDTGGVVIDALRSNDSASEDLEQSIAAADLPEGYELVLGSGTREAGCGMRDAGSGAIVIPSEVRNLLLVPQTLHSESRASRDPHPAEACIVARDDRELKLNSPSDAQTLRLPQEPTLGVGRSEPNESATDLVLFPHRDDGAQTLISGEPRPHQPQGDGGILPTANAAPPTTMHAGRAHDPALPLIQLSDSQSLTVTAATATAVAKREESTVPSSGDEPTLTVEAELVIFARNDKKRTLRIADGRPLDQKDEPVIVANSEAMMTKLLAGRQHDGAGWVIHRRGKERARVTSVADGRAHPHEQIVLAGGDDEWMTSLLAGSGVGQIHERVILGQDDEWLRPSLVAG